ncbi:MAG: energy-coupling factor transporter ATPase [Coriobacteriia bacterium]|nr:energy-coupling factor transporter ATPase [Coriobacteriia bacterium]MCL2137076.1 energy-coupling factor transporter ATPase [Coriobacteriia bacterium]
MPDVEFQSVTFHYPASPNHGEKPAAGSSPPIGPDGLGQTEVLQGLTLSIQRGEFVAVIGANGSGKTTFARHINALLVPDSGKVLTVGLDTSDPQQLFVIRSHAGMVFQNPDTQMVANIVADDVAFGPENLNILNPELSERVEQALAAVDMLGFLDANPARLSGGERQRVSIAGILAMQPDILILDEPAAMLDVRGRTAIRSIVDELNQKGMTVVLITHSMEDAILADRVIVIDRGRVALDGKPLDVFREYRLLDALGLDVPFTMQLIEALKDYGISLSVSLDSDDLVDQICNWFWNN